MQHYLDLLIADMRLEAKNLPQKPYYDIPPEAEGIEYVVEWGNAISRPMQEWTCIAKENLPARIAYTVLVDYFGKPVKTPQKEPSRKKRSIRWQTTAKWRYPKNTVMFRATFTDNEELEAYSIDIHHNFDHHSHSTGNEECELDPPKDPTDDVFLFIETYTIPEGQITYDAEVSIEVPENADPGDYHLFVALTDKEGWQTIKGFGIKILGR